MGTAFLLLGGLLLWRDHVTVAKVLAGVGGILILGGALAPALLGPVQRAWMAFAHAISRVTTPLFMGIVYYGAVMPIGLVLRALGKDPLRRSRTSETFWVDRRLSVSRRGDLTRQF